MEVLSSFVCLVFLTTLFCFAVGQEMITIIRNPGSGDPWNDFDRFKLPDSKCSSVYCNNWKAYAVASQPCHCECSYRQAATFGFYSGSWTCLANTEVRKHAGCKYKLQSEQKNVYPLRIVKQGIKYNTVLPSRQCSVDQTTSRYFTCDGTWAAIDSQPLSQWFSIEDKKKTSANRRLYEVYIGSNITTSLLGRIISLSIICPQEHSCLLLKLNGKFQCAVNATHTTVPTTRAPIATPATEGTSAPANTTVNPNDDGRKEKALTSGGSSAGTVVGVVVTLVIIVAIVIVIVVYVYRKRKRGESVWLADYISSRVGKSRSTQPKKKTAYETPEEPEYAEIPEEQRGKAPVDEAGGIYSYAFDDPQTAYIAPQPAPYNRLVHNQPDQEGAIYSTADDGPVYNVLERPTAEKHITMTPESTRNEGPPPQDLKPECRVLEGPDTAINDRPPSQDYEPEYHVLEGETTDSPLNGNTDARASTGTANPSAPHAGHLALKERRRPPSPPRKR